MCCGERQYFTPLDNCLIGKQTNKSCTLLLQGTLACDICEGLIEILDKYIEDNATDDKINQTLYSLCSGLPDGALSDLVSCTVDVTIWNYYKNKTSYK